MLTSATRATLEQVKLDSEGQVRHRMNHRAPHRLTAGLLAGILLVVGSTALAQTYNMFSPGGALSGTWNSQNVNLAAGAPFIVNTLPAANVANLGANPTSPIGLTAVNGSAATYLRSDGSPALSLAIAPNFSSPWTSSPWVWSNAEPRLGLVESDQGTDLKAWDLDVQAGLACLRTRTDADAAGVNGLCFTRGTTTNISLVTFGNATSNPAYTFLGTGQMNLPGGATMSSGGTFTVGKLQVNSPALPANGVNLPATNTVGFVANTTQVGSWTTGQLTLTTGIQSGGTKFTATGCSNSTTVGGAFAGKFTAGVTGTCAVVITLPTAANGWTCYASDITTPVIFTQTASATTSCTISATTVTSDVVTFMAMAY